MYRSARIASLLLAVLAVLMTSCVDFDGQTLTYRHDRKSDQLLIFQVYERIHVSGKEPEFTEKEGRLRHEIRKKIRNSELRELNENNLGLLERRILTTCNHLLEEDLLLGIGFKSYQLIEQ